MHIIGVIIALATAVFWVGRAARSAKDIAEMASTLKKMQKPNRFKTRSSKRDITAIDEPMDAAVVLMICVASLSSFGKMGATHISDAAQTKITELLVQYMQLTKSEAVELLGQMLWTTENLSDPKSALSPMSTIIGKQINHEDAQDLSTMLRAIAHADGTPNAAQNDFILRFGDRLGLPAP